MNRYLNINVRQSSPKENVRFDKWYKLLKLWSQHSWAGQFFFLKRNLFSQKGRKILDENAKFKFFYKSNSFSQLSSLVDEESTSFLKWLDSTFSSSAAFFVFSDPFGGGCCWVDFCCCWNFTDLLFLPFEDCTFEVGFGWFLVLMADLLAGFAISVLDFSRSLISCS